MDRANNTKLNVNVKAHLEKNFGKLDRIHWVEINKSAIYTDVLFREMSLLFMADLCFTDISLILENVWIYPRCTIRHDTFHIV